MGPLNTASPSGSGRDGEGRNVVDPQKRTSITMLVLGDGTLSPCAAIYVHLEGEKSIPSYIQNRKQEEKEFFFLWLKSYSCLGIHVLHVQHFCSIFLFP